MSSTTGRQPKPTILITGLNGYIAGRTAELALKSGYRVRGTVRTNEAGVQVKEALCCLGYHADDIEVIQITDLCQYGPLEVAAKGCCAILHLATPLRHIGSLAALDIVRVAVKSTETVLNAAAKAGDAMESVVLVSSAAAMFDLYDDMLLQGRLYTEKDWNNYSEQVLKEKGDLAGYLHGYLESKTAGEKLFWKFRQEHKPSFAMTALQPTYTIGTPLIPWEKTEDIPCSMIQFLEIVTANTIPEPMFVYGDTVDIRDVARMLLWPVQHPKKADGQRFVCSSAVGGGQAIVDILNKERPSLKVERGTPGQGYLPDYEPKAGIGAFDGSKAVLATGQNWIPYEQSVVELVDFLERYRKDTQQESTEGVYRMH